MCSYTEEFYASLERGQLVGTFQSPHIDLTPDQIELVRRVLRSGSMEQRRLVLQALKSTPARVSEFRKELRRLFVQAGADQAALTADAGLAKQGASEGLSAQQKNSALSLQLRVLELHNAALRVGGGSGAGDAEGKKTSRSNVGAGSSSDGGNMGTRAVHEAAPGLFSMRQLCSMLRAPDTPVELRVAAALACASGARQRGGSGSQAVLHDAERESTATIWALHEVVTSERQRELGMHRRDSTDDVAGRLKLRTAAAIALLRMTEWMNVEAHVELQKLLLAPIASHAESIAAQQLAAEPQKISPRRTSAIGIRASASSTALGSSSGGSSSSSAGSAGGNALAALDKERCNKRRLLNAAMELARARVGALELIGRHAPALISDGYLVYLLRQTKSEEFAHAAARIARGRLKRARQRENEESGWRRLGRSSRSHSYGGILVRPLVSRLASARCRPAVVAALQECAGEHVWDELLAAANKAVAGTLGSSESHAQVRTTHVICVDLAIPIRWLISCRRI